MTPVERVARAIARERDAFHFPDCPEQWWLNYTDEARAALAVAAAIVREEIAAIRAQGHITDTDAEQGMREMRAMAVWRVVERIEGDGHD